MTDKAGSGQTAEAAFKAYWTAYGGFKALRKSWYLYWAFVFSLLPWSAWVVERAAERPKWTQLAIDVLPSMVSFSLGALAIILTMGSGPFMKLLRAEGAPNSPYIKFVAVFFHFILVQMGGVALATLCTFVTTTPLSYLGFLVLCHAITSGVAAAAALFGIAQMRNLAAIIGD